jgi:hypothetical protein
VPAWPKPMLDGDALIAMMRERAADYERQAQAALTAEARQLLLHTADSYRRIAIGG